MISFTFDFSTCQIWHIGEIEALRSFKRGAARQPCPRMYPPLPGMIRRMDTTIRLLCPDDVPAIVHLSLAAWAPVFESFRLVLGEAIYERLYPDWVKAQADVVESACREPETHTVWVAEVAGCVVGFIVLTLHRERQTGEVYLLAVHPDHQNRGIGTKLNCFVLDQLREAGMTLAEVGTGGDPGHAPARRSYEKAGYTALPLVRYYKAL